MTWPARAFLQELGGGRLREEERLVAEALARRGIPVALFPLKRLQRRQVPLDRDSLLVGDGAAVSLALRQLGVEPPPPLDYPEALRPFLLRPVWQSTVGRLLTLEAPLFAKPAARAKRFTGRVFAGPEDLYYLHGTSSREPIWCSPPVSWRAEWRAYVLGDRVLDLCWYSGDAGLAPDLDTLQAMLRAFRSSGSAPAACALDVGVLEDGRTALVEANDALALGAYGLAADSYTELLLARWAELVACPERS